MLTKRVPIGVRIRLLFGGKSTLFGWIWIGIIAAFGVYFHVGDLTTKPGEASVAPYNHETCTTVLVVMSLGFAMMSYEVVSGLRTLALLRRHVALRAVIADAEVEGRITRITLEYEQPTGVTRRAKRVYRDVFSLDRTRLASELPIFVDTQRPEEIRTRYDLPESVMAPNGELGPGDVGDWFSLLIPGVAFGTMVTFLGYLVRDWIS